MTVGRSHFELRKHKQKRRKESHVYHSGSGGSAIHGEVQSAGAVQPRKKKVQGDLTCVYKYLVWSNEEEGPRLFSVMPMDQKRGNGHKSKNKKYKNVFTVQMVKHWNKLSRDVVVFICGSKLNWIWVWTTCSSWLCLSRRFALEDFCIHNSLILWKVSKKQVGGHREQLH